MVMQTQHAPKPQTMTVPLLSKQITAEEKANLVKARQRGIAMGVVERVAASAIPALIPTKMIAWGNPDARAKQFEDLALCAVELGMAVLESVYRNEIAISSISDEYIDRLIAEQTPKPEITQATKEPVVIEAYN